MSLVLLNGEPVVSAVIARPLAGVWHAELEVDSSALPSGTATLSVADGALSLVGTVSHGAATREDRVLLRLVGGAGGLPTVLPARAYRDAPARVLLADLLSSCGERLAESSDAALLAKRLSWARLLRPACGSLSSLVSLADPAAVWRATASGAVFVGVNAWPDFALDYDLIDEDPAARRMVIASDDPTLTAGVTLDGRRVERVVHRYMPGLVRSEVWFQ